MTEPTRVTYGEWEPVYGPEETRQVATRIVGWILRTVTEWRQVTSRPIVGYRRKRYEHFETPAARAPRFATAPVATIGDGPVTEAVIAFAEIPATHSVRWDWETRD